MAKIVTAVYEKGVLRPLQPLGLEERQRVQLQVLPEEPVEDEGERAIRILVAAGPLTPPPRRPDVAPVSKEPADETGEVEQVIQSLIAAGLMRPRLEDTPPPDPVSEEERCRLADVMGKAPGKPLSEIIIKERGDW